MNTDKNNLQQISNIFKWSKTFFIAGHIKPDGDSLGSALALALELKKLGKKVSVYCADEIPDYLKFLKGSETIKKTAKKTDFFDCAIILECMDFARMGNIIGPKQTNKIINIDHHLAHTNFGAVNYIVPTSSSTAELILNIFEYMKIKLSQYSAECLYTGLLTDTGRFQQLNTTANSHIAAAKLMQYNIDINKIYKKIYENSSISALKLQGLALRSIKTTFDDKFAYIILTKDMFKKSGMKTDNSEGIINYTLRIKNVEVGCLFQEIDKKNTKISFRSIKDFNVLEIAQKFGGGGHKNAAGCSLKLGINSAVKEIDKILKEKFNGKNIQ
jgi:phosphoesterase RecJ-like protein